MRPHRLRLAAFGPFADEVEVDFDALAASGLFLLHGDTGSGKTSILDGVAFGLYGRVPGQRAGAGRLRCDLADPALRTSVELEVTVAGRRLRIQRFPEQSRPKQRGAGTTRDPAKVLLQEAVDGGWRTISTRVGEADAELSQLLGMSAEQFHQVVLLPQGEFARFLRSDATERARLLQRLFATDRFRRAEDWLAERRRETAAAYESARAAVLRAAARIAQVAGVEEPVDDDGGVPATGWADQLTQDAESTATRAEQEAERATGRQTAAEAAVAGARDLYRRQQRRRELLHRRDQLRAAAGQVAEAGERLDLGRRAAPLRPLLEHLDRRRRQADRVSRDLQRARSLLAEHELEMLSPEDLRGAAVRRREALGRLEAAERLEAELRDERSRAATAARAAAAALAERDDRLREMKALPERRRAVLDEVERIEQARARVPELQAELDRGRRAATDATRLSDARTARTTTAERLLAAREGAVTLREEASRLRVERVDGMIAELAAALVDGDPCPVCGATEHPDPSEVRGSRTTREQEDAAWAAAESAQQLVTELTAELAGLDAEIDGCTRRLQEAGAEGHAPAELLAVVVEAERELAAAARLLEQADEVAGRLAALDQAEQDLRGAVHEAEQTHARQEERSEQAEQRAASLAAQVTEVLGGARDVAQARAREQRVLDLIDAAVEAAARSGVAADELRAAEEECRRAVETAGFSTLEQARVAALDAQAMRTLESLIEEARSAEVAVAAALAEPDVDVDLAVPAPVATVQQELEEARAAAAAAAATATRARSRVEQLSTLAPGFEAQLRALAPLGDRAAEVRQLADLVSGQGANRLKMTLSAYVLAARLEEVAAVASERLRAMTQGRYTLVHTDAGRGSGRAGLGLLARDTWTGQDRDTATLSGGETFLASLALALALGDVVTAEAGGTGVEALFVDEGFGSLDEETLEEVMDTLDGLREGGRMVGLVSHVGELRSRIPAQLHVRKGRSGSTVSLRTG